MKSKLLKTVVLASSLVFLNCGDDAALPSIPNYGNLSSSSVETLPGESSDSQGASGTEISSSAVQQGGDEIVPGSSADVGPQVQSSSAVTPGAESSAGVAASSSSIAAPVSSSATAPVVSSSSEKAPAVSSSSSEEKVESSSSEAPKPKGVFLAEGTDETKDQLKVKYIERTGHDGGGILAYPEQLSNDQKHAVVVWGLTALS